MSYLIGVPVLALLAILQSSAFTYIHLLDGRFDLVLLCVVGWGLAGRSEEAMVWGMVGGLFLDFLSGLPLGSYAIPLIIIAFLVSLLEGRFWEEHFLTPIGVVFLSSLIFHGLGLIVLTLVGREWDLLISLTRVILPSTFLNLLLAIPTAQIMEGLRTRLYPPKVEI